MKYINAFEKFGAIIGFLIVYIISTIIFYIILGSLETLPYNINIYIFSIITADIILFGAIIKEIIWK